PARRPGLRLTSLWSSRGSLRVDAGSGRRRARTAALPQLPPPCEQTPRRYLQRRKRSTAPHLCPPATYAGGSGRRRRLSGRLWVPLFRRSVVFGGAGGGEVGRGQHGQRDVGVPGSVVADLVLVEPGFVLRGLEALLDRPPGA